MKGNIVIISISIDITRKATRKMPISGRNNIRKVIVRMNMKPLMKIIKNPTNIKNIKKDTITKRLPKNTPIPIRNRHMLSTKDPNNTNNMRRPPHMLSRSMLINLPNMNTRMSTPTIKRDVIINNIISQNHAVPTRLRNMRKMRGR